MKKSNRSNVDPFIVMDVMEAARKEEQSGKNIIHMEVGQPGTPAPKLSNETVRPKYRKKLKIKDLINCIKNLSILVNFVFFLYI